MEDLPLHSNAAARKQNADDDSDDEAAAPATSMDANERRKQFLTMSNLKRVFRALDLGEDGYIDVEELYEAQKKIGGTLTKDEVRDVVWEVDDNMTGKLDMGQYLTAYRRSQMDESGFEPKRFWAIVEFLLMDRDCSGEISLDEAMTTIFERQGADDLASVTQSFFIAAGVGAGEDPPPGATVTFMGYYNKVGRAKPRPPEKIDLVRSWSNQLRIDAGKRLPPKLLNSSRSGHMLPSLHAAAEEARLAASRPPRRVAGKPMTAPRPGSRSPPKSAKAAKRPATSPNVLGGAPSSSSSSIGGGGASKVLSALTGSPSRGGFGALQPLSPTVGLAASAMSYAGSGGGKADIVKERASTVLRVNMSDAARPELS